MQVYVARWNHTRVAVKVLLEQDEAQQRQFCEEANLLRSLRHPNIVLFLGACLQKGKKVRHPNNV
jgi:serine/threonine-protein kinase CTR1